MLTTAAPVLAVCDISAGLAFYRDILGFKPDFEYGQPVFYICLCRDDVQLHLVTAAASGRIAGQGAVCMFVRDVDAFYAEIKSKGATPAKPPQTYDYGMREFDIFDADGNRLIFGASASAQSGA